MQIQMGDMSIRQGWRAPWDINVAGTQVLTNLAVPPLLKSSEAHLECAPVIKHLPQYHLLLIDLPSHS